LCGRDFLTFFEGELFPGFFSFCAFLKDLLKDFGFNALKFHA